MIGTNILRLTEYYYTWNVESKFIIVSRLPFHVSPLYRKNYVSNITRVGNALFKIWISRANPRDLWLLPWAAERYPDTVEQINRDFPSDFVTVDFFIHRLQRWRVILIEWKLIPMNGLYICELSGRCHREVKEPLVSDINDWRQAEPPYEQLQFDIKSAKKNISEFYEKTEKFVFANCCPRPWERYQFLRGTENALLDVMTPKEGGIALLGRIHEFYLKELEFWVNTDVDAIRFMDDWGSQNQLLIPPRIWRTLFKPLYKDYCDLAHDHGNLPSCIPMDIYQKSMKTWLKFMLMPSIPSYSAWILRSCKKKPEVKLPSGVKSTGSMFYPHPIRRLARCSANRSKTSFWSGRRSNCPIWVRGRSKSRDRPGDFRWMAAIWGRNREE